MNYDTNIDFIMKENFPMRKYFRMIGEVRSQSPLEKDMQY